jgi:putative glycosyltransferase (TIGR04372 family)
MGHLAGEIDWYLKKQAMGEIPKVKPVIVIRDNEAVNPAMLHMWGAHVTVITDPLRVRLLRPFTFFHHLRIRLRPSFFSRARTCDYQNVLKRWQKREPIFKLPADVERRGYENLKAMGMPADAWFVCIHARDGIFSPVDENIHSFRNCDIESYNLAVDEIIARGGWCVRMGESTTKSLAERPGLINYPSTTFKSDWMDVFLCAKARFFLGNSSGLCIISTIAGVPCALANMIPHGACFGVSPGDITIPKNLFHEDGGQPTFKEIFLSEIGSFRDGYAYKDSGLVIVDNTLEQIRDLAVEMLDALDGRIQRTDDDETRQEIFRSLVQPHHYTYGSPSRVGSAFLKENERLL